jgi:hypothetical protein
MVIYMDTFANLGAVIVIAEFMYIFYLAGFFNWAFWLLCIPYKKPSTPQEIKQVRIKMHRRANCMLAYCSFLLVLSFVLPEEPKGDVDHTLDWSRGFNGTDNITV